MSQINFFIRYAHTITRWRKNAFFAFFCALMLVIPKILRTFAGEMKLSRIVYYLLFALVIGAMIVAMALIPKAEIHLGLNGCHTPFADLFWRYYTKLAEWPLYLLMLVPLWGIWHAPKTQRMQQHKMVGMFAMAEILSAAIVQIIKALWNMPRPATYFDMTFGSTDMLPLVEGVRMHAWHSFPSGHTATFFVFFTMAFLLLSENYSASSKSPSRTAPNSTHPLQLTTYTLPLITLVCAFAGGFSRIYLSQHFLLDVCVGAIIGCLSATLVYFLLGNKVNKKRV